MNQPIVPPVGLFAEGEIAVPFTPKADDRYATGAPAREYFTLTPEGYLKRVARGGGFGSYLATLTAEGADVPVIYSRFVGDTALFTLAPALTIPDAV